MIVVQLFRKHFITMQYFVLKKKTNNYQKEITSKIHLLIFYFYQKYNFESYVVVIYFFHIIKSLSELNSDLLTKVEIDLPSKKMKVEIDLKY